MATSTKAPPDYSAYVKWVSEQIKLLQFDWAPEHTFDLSQFSPRNRVQNRHSQRNTDRFAPQVKIEEYATKMEHTPMSFEDDNGFPPGLCTSDAYLLDGSTKVGAKLKRGEKFAPMMVLDVAYADATESQRNRMVMLGAILNGRNGTPNESAETRENVLAFIAEGVTTDNIAAWIGMPASKVTTVRCQIRAEQRLTAVGLPLNGDNPYRDASLKALGGEKVVSLNDEPYKRLAVLVADAQLNASEITALTKECMTAGSDVAALDVLTKARDEHDGRIKEYKLTKRIKSPGARRLRQHLGWIEKHVSEDYLEKQPAMFTQYEQSLSSVIAILQSTLTRQQQHRAEKETEAAK